MPEIERPANFKKKLWKKPNEMQGKIAAAVKQLGDDPWYPSLQTSRLTSQGPDRWYARVDGGSRITFDWVGNVIKLRVHCNHDILKRP